MPGIVLVTGETFEAPAWSSRVAVGIGLALLTAGCGGSNYSHVSGASSPDAMDAVEKTDEFLTPLVERDYRDACEMLSQKAMTTAEYESVDQCAVRQRGRCAGARGSGGTRGRKPTS